ncbi:MAG: transposase family protein [Actinobacteria bacterium]|nr:transposase family protein [Actinomycetota bacterium]
MRARGAGHKFNLELPERLLMSLMYFRLYITQALLGYLFDLDSSNVNREINGRMLAVLSEVLPVPARDEPLLSDPLGAQATASSSSSAKRKRKGLRRSAL